MFDAANRVQFLDCISDAQLIQIDGQREQKKGQAKGNDVRKTPTAKTQGPRFGIPRSLTYQGESSEES